MTSTGIPPGAVVPIQRAPNLDPADLPNVPRWLDELREVERTAAGRARSVGSTYTDEQRERFRWLMGKLREERRLQ